VSLKKNNSFTKFCTGNSRSDSLIAWGHILPDRGRPWPNCPSRSASWSN